MKLTLVGELVWSLSSIFSGNVNGPLAFTGVRWRLLEDGEISVADSNRQLVGEAGKDAEVFDEISVGGHQIGLSVDPASAAGPLIQPEDPRCVLLQQKRSSSLVKVLAVEVLEEGRWSSLNTVRRAAVALARVED